ncbi:hypothetical protein [Algoriphagus chordae]|uniref:Lipoprotein n=1 Tax=Algoriphagus chordae TaxID=237019 RepID=A0A2W7QP90_9BACT|nr:hypothetical protein [Algoriphagus chordae]PZX49116.1 hypothetical protein LV85_03247 [Algoriphagus chordae]
MKIHKSSLLISTLLVGCATIHIPITQNIDEFSGAKTIKMDNCKLEPNYPSRIEGFIFNIGDKDFELNLEYITSKSGEEQLSVIAEIETNDPFMIDQGESLIILIDEEPIKLSTEGAYNSDSDIKNTGYSIKALFSSKAKFPISREIISKIANSNVVKARLLGYDPNSSQDDKPALEGIFVEINKNAYRDFLAKIPVG